MSIDVYAVDDSRGWEREDGSWVNMASVNAADVVAALGLDWSEVSQGTTLDAEDLLGRCLMALAVAPADEGFDTYELTADEVGANPLLAALAGGEGGPRVYRGGRQPGYVQDRLRQVHAIAEAAHARRGSRIRWLDRCTRRARCDTIEPQRRKDPTCQPSRPPRRSSAPPAAGPSARATTSAPR